MLEKEFKYFKDHLSELVQEYQGKFVVIKNNSVIGVYESDEEAYNESKKDHELGTFLIQHCLSGDNDLKLTFHSRVVFNHATQV